MLAESENSHLEAYVLRCSGWIRDSRSSRGRDCDRCCGTVCHLCQDRRALTPYILDDQREDDCQTTFRDHFSVSIRSGKHVGGFNEQFILLWSDLPRVVCTSPADMRISHKGLNLEAPATPLQVWSGPMDGQFVD